jgi:REP element-mobilizing transposase RayT
MELIKLAHCVYQCDYHVVLVTKYRRAIFKKGVFAYIDKKVGGDHQALSINSI